jgi:hypothetical protein
VVGIALAALFVLGEVGALVGAWRDVGSGWTAALLSVVVWLALIWHTLLAATYPIRIIRNEARQEGYRYRLIHLRAAKS